MPTKVGDHFELTLENMPAYDDEPFSPPALNEKARVDFLYTLGDTDPDKYWKKVGDNFTENIESFIGKPKGVQTETMKAVGDAATEEAKAKRIYARVQQVRNLSYEPEKTEKEENREKLRDNKSAEDVLNNGYGWRAEINGLFVAMARAAGLTANVVQAASRDEIFFAQQVPDSSQLDTQIASVMIDGKELFVDPATPFAPFGTLRWEVTGTAGLKLVKKASTFVDTPHLTAAQALLTRKADLQIDGDVVKGTVKITYNGERALVRRLAGRNDDEAKNKKTMEDDAKAWLPGGSTVKLKSYGPLKGSDEPLVAELDVEMPNLGSFAGSRVLLPLSVFSESAKNPLAVEKRKHDMYYEYERQTDDEVVLHIPEGYSIEAVPQGLSNNLGALIFKTTWSRDAQSVTFKRTLSVHTLAIARTSYPQVRSFYTRVSTADQDNLILKKTPKAAAK